MHTRRRRCCKRPPGLAGRAGPVARPFARHEQSSGLFVSGFSPPHRAWAARGAESAQLANAAQPSGTLQQSPVRQRARLQLACRDAVRRRSAQRTRTSSRYISRPAIANERLKRNRAGQIVLQLNSAYQDGTTHIVMSPLEFMQRGAALVPRPRLHLIRFRDVLAPHGSSCARRSCRHPQRTNPGSQPITPTRSLRPRA